MKPVLLRDIYSSLGLNEGKVFVVPKIRYNYPSTDYLYLLYQKMIHEKDYSISDLSVFGHYRFLFSRLKLQQQVLHYHWLEFQDIKALLGMPWKLLCIWLYKILGGKIVWTIHNLEPHDQKLPRLHRFIHKWMANKADAVLLHCRDSVKLVSEYYDIPESKLQIISHPTFPAKQIHRAEALKFIESNFGITLNPARPSFLLFGNISKYKGLPEIIDNILSVDTEAQIIIAGSVKKHQQHTESTLKEIAEQNSNVHLVNSFIREDWVPYFFSAVNFCAFNFEQILTSGSVMMALSYGKIVLAPSMGCLKELDSNKSVFLFSDEEEKMTQLNKLIHTFYHEQD